MIYMPLVKSIKNIGTSGTSKVIPVTQEIKALGLDVRDSVVAALAVPGSEEDYALNLASAFINPDVFYVNNRIMCCKDRYPNGQCIENRLNSRSFDDCEQAYRRMAAMQDLIDVIREYTKNKVSDPTPITTTNSTRSSPNSIPTISWMRMKLALRSRPSSLG